MALGVLLCYSLPVPLRQGLFLIPGLMSQVGWERVIPSGSLVSARSELGLQAFVEVPALFCGSS